MNNKRSALLLCLALAGLRCHSLELWQFPEAAEKNTVFLSMMFASLSFETGFSANYPTLSIDYLLPLPLPFSAGLYMKIPDPDTNFKSFGTRLAYHINLPGRTLDLYALYVFEFGFLREQDLAPYNDTPPPVRWYDFRAGLRRLFGKHICLTIETGYHLWDIMMGVSIKI